jgi:hypothetical protein
MSRGTSFIKRYELPTKATDIGAFRTAEGRIKSSVDVNTQAHTTVAVAAHAGILLPNMMANCSMM